MLYTFKNSPKLLPFALQLGLVESLDAGMWEYAQEQAKKRNQVLPWDLCVALLRILHVFVLSRMTNIIIQI